VTEFGPPPTTLEAALAENALLRQLVHRLEARIEELERRLAQNSRNSSKPPSSDPPGLKRPAKPTSKRKPGGQPGHKGNRRELLPPERVNEFVEVWPEQCEGCQAELPGQLRAEVGEPSRHQVSEIPELVARVTEYRLHTQCCPGCNWSTTAKLPDGVPVFPFGPRLLAFIAVCTGVYRFSKRMLSGAMEDLFGVPISTGAIINCERRMSAIVAPAVEEARAYVQQEPVVHADETGWREGRKRAWLWTACTSAVAVFLIHARRGAAAMKQLLGAFAGVLVSDRWGVYEGHGGLRQLCWSHLRRHFEEFAEYREAVAEIGRALLVETRQLFRLWHRVRDGTLDRASFKKRVGPLRTRVEMLLLAGMECSAQKPAATCRELWRLREHLWTFVDVENVEPTNNAAERALRSGVLMRKGSFGTHSPEGSRYVERMLTVGTTLRLQQRNVVDYLVAASERALRRLRPHSLLPAPRPRVVPPLYLQAAATA
jgi:transposase